MLIFLNKFSKISLGGLVIKYSRNDDSYFYHYDLTDIFLYDNTLFIILLYLKYSKKSQ